MASVSRATCWVTSTSATARSRVAFRMESPSVQTSTTSPVLAAAALPKRDNPRQQRDDQTTVIASVQQIRSFSR